MDNNNISTVTVAACAYNEAQNIENFLKSVLRQKQEGYILKKILIISDGSTDETVNVARSVHSPLIEIIENKKRVGKSTHLNTIYLNLTSDFLVQSDCDVIFAHENVIDDIIKPLVQNPRVGMSGGNPTPLPAKSFWERVVQVAFEPYQDFRSRIRGGNNAFSAVGQILGYRKELLKSITIPVDMVTNDLYTYFCCLSLKWQYRYVNSAVVLFQSPKNLKDFMRQNTRFYTGYLRMFNYFNKELVEVEMNIPKFIKFTSLAKQFIKHPTNSFIYFFVNIYCKLTALISGSKLNALWSIAVSTKKLSIKP